MNMKPDTKMIEKWWKQASDEFAFTSDGEIRKRFSELAAQWGAEQAKSSTPSVEHCLWARNGHTPCQHTQQREPVGHCPQAQQTAEPEPPEAAVNVSPYDPNHVYWNAGHSNDGVNSPLFTATQMHAHFQAGVRAGGKDAKRLQRIAHLIGSIFVHGEFKAETGNERELEKLLRENGTFWESLEAYDAAMQGGQQ